MLSAMDKTTAYTYIVISRAGAHRDLSKDSRQQPFWDEHAAYIDRLVAEGFIVMGGPLVDEGGAMLILQGTDEDGVREKLRTDPWYEHDILRLESIARWQIFIDERKGSL